MVLFKTKEAWLGTTTQGPNFGVTTHFCWLVCLSSLLYNLSIAFLCLWLLLADEQNRIIEAGGWVESNRVNGEYGHVTIM